MKRIPTEREITDLIAAAFERLPAPDPLRLTAIGQRMPGRPRPRGPRTIAWLALAGALMAGAASALWWAVDRAPVEDRGGPPPAPAVAPPAAGPSLTDQPARPARSDAVQAKPAGDSAQKRGRVIYQREQ